MGDLVPEAITFASPPIEDLLDAVGEQWRQRLALSTAIIAPKRSIGPQRKRTLSNFNVLQKRATNGTYVEFCSVHWVSRMSAQTMRIFAITIVPDSRFVVKRRVLAFSGI